MPLLGGFFNKRDRQTSSSRNVGQSTATGSVASFASTRDSTDLDYVFPDKSLPPPGPLYSLPAAASSSKLKLPFRRKQVPQADPNTSTSVVSLNDAPSPPNTSSLTSDSGHGLPPPPPRASLFGVHNESTQSIHSLPNESSNHHFDTPNRSSSFDVRSEAHSTPSTPPVPPKKSTGLFSWTRERTKSKPPQPNASLSSAASASTGPEDSSFNLKSFRHIRAESPAASPETPAPCLSSSSLAPPQPRPRENSTASDSSQRMSVAAFREAQARRANSPVPSFRPPSSADTLRLDVTGRKRASTVSVVTPDRPQPNMTPAGPISSSPLDSSALQTSSSDESESEDEDDEDVDSDGEPISKPTRKRTITRVNGSRARSDAGHSSAHSSQEVAQTRIEPSRSPKTESTVKNQSDLPSATRQRASASTSALTPNAAARRASTLAAANSSLGLPAPPKLSARKPKDIHDSESSDTSDSESEGLPLSGLIPPRRPGSSASNQSAGRARAPHKPLIDINSLAGGPPLLTPILRHEDSVKNLSGRNAEKDEPFSVPAALIYSSPSPTTPSSAPSSQSANKQSIPPVNKPTSPAYQRGPTTEAPTLPKPKTSDHDDDLMNAIRLVNSLDKALEQPPLLSESQPKSDRIVPTPIRAREPPTSFTVLSRPPHRQSLEATASLSPTTSQAQQSQSPSVPSPPALSPQSAFGARQRAPTVVNPPPQNDRSDAISVHSTARSSASRASSRAPPVPLIHSIPDSPSVKEEWKTGGRPRATSRGTAYNPPERRAQHPPMPTSASSNMISSGYQPSLMPQRPFASNSSIRGESPAGSSTGDSSSGRAPFTPRDGSDIGVRTRDDGSDVGSTLKARGHAKKPSVTFEDEPFRGRERAKPELTNEERTRERRRSEAKAAIKLGKIVNGRGPLNDSDDDLGLNSRNPTISVTPIGMDNTGMTAPGWGAGWQQPMVTGMAPMVPPQFNNDPAFLAAHQRALLIAKQAYQMAVAQHAMQVASEEWERGSTIGFGSGGSVYGGGSGGSVYGGGGGGSVYGGGGGSVYGGGGGSVYGGVGGGMAPMGMMGMPSMGMLMPPNQWSRSSVMFPSAGSVYGGISSSQSEFGGGGGGGGWGSRSAYGDSFGASSRTSYMSNGAPNSSASAYGGGSRPRARTGVTPPSGSAGQQTRTPGKSPAVKAPPSSWKNGR